MILTHLASFYEFYATENHGRLVMSKHFKLCVEFGSQLMGPTYVDMYSSHGLVNFSVGDTLE